MKETRFGPVLGSLDLRGKRPCCLLLIPVLTVHGNGRNEEKRGISSIIESFGPANTEHFSVANPECRAGGNHACPGGVHSLAWKPTLFMSVPCAKSSISALLLYSESPGPSANVHVLHRLKRG